MKYIRLFYVIILLISNVTYIHARNRQKVVIDPKAHHLTDIQVGIDETGSVVFKGEDLYFVNQSGNPDIPYRHFQVLLPANCDATSIRLDLDFIQWETLQGKYHLQPAPPVATRDNDDICVLYPEDYHIVNNRNLTVYQNENWYPTIHTTEIYSGFKGTYLIASFDIPGFRYKPVTKQLQKIVGGVVSVYFDTKDFSVDTEQDFFPELPEDILLTEDALSSYVSAPQDGVNTITGYAIITTSTIAAAATKLNEFINAKENMGFTVHLVTESQWGGSTGNTAAENIRNWLQNNYSSLNLEYLLLIGDPNPSDGDVPMKMLWPRNNATNYTQYKKAPSDYYYSDMNGNWDLDGDGYYGEWGDDTGSGGCERTYEIIVGRIPYYGSSTTLDQILNKLICFTFEPLSMSGWRQSVILPMEPSDKNTPGYHLGEAIKDNFVATKPGWTSHRIYDSDYGLPDPPETTPCNYSNVYNAWIDDHPAAAFWWTHGGSTVAADIMNTTYASMLNDSLPAFTFQCSCNNAYPEVSNNLAYSMLKNGSPGACAATRVSWYYVGQTYFNNSASNSGMTYEFAERLVGAENRCGFSLFDLKQDLSIYSDEFWMNCCVFNLYGDPSLGLITPCPDLITLENADVDTNSWRFYSASSNIVFAGNSNTYTVEGGINSGATVTATNDSSITLNPGFHAEAGCRFNAWIGDGCSAPAPMLLNYQYLTLMNTDEPDFIHQNREIQIYPNPSTGRFSVNFANKEVIADISIMNLQGVEVHKKHLKNQSKVELDISHLLCGVYIIILQSKYQVATGKIIIH